MTLLREQVRNLLSLDYEKEIERIASCVRKILREKLHKRGLVVAISGGIDSSVCAALAVKAIGRKKVFGLLMPEQESSKNSGVRGVQLAESLGIKYTIQDIGPVLEALGCYKAKEDAIKEILPGYASGWKSKIVIAGGLKGQINHFRLVARSPEGQLVELRLPLNAYSTIVAATNHKQRIRKTLEYFHADRLNYAVVGTPNYLEYALGFFVKNGDGSADLKPIAHLYKTQVYEMAKVLGLPAEICEAEPTTDTYSLPQGQDEFYFGLPYHLMDAALHFQTSGKSARELAALLKVDEEYAAQIYADMDSKRNTTEYLHLPPILIKSIC